MSRGFPARARNLALAGVLVFVGIIGALTCWTLVASRDARDWAHHTSDVLGAIQDLDIAIADAETVQCGYLLTGSADYLSPYNAAVGRVALLESTMSRLTADNPVQQDRLRTLAPLLQSKLDELTQTIELRRDVSADAALRLVETGNGRSPMQQIKAVLTDMTATETTLLGRRIASADRFSAIGRGLALVGCILSLALLAAAARLLRGSADQLIASETEHRELARQLSATLDSISEGIGVFDASRRLVRWNPSLLQLLALPEEIVRQETRYGALADPLSAAALAGTPLLESEDQIRHGHPFGTVGAPILYQRTRDSDRRTFEFRRTAMLGGGFVLTVADITERLVSRRYCAKHSVCRRWAN